MLSTPADDRRVISHRFDCLLGMPDRANAVGPGCPLHATAELNVVDDGRPLELPRIAKGKPFLRIFLLPAISDHLAKEPMIVANAVAKGRNPKRRHAFHE